MNDTPEQTPQETPEPPRHEYQDAAKKAAQEAATKAKEAARDALGVFMKLIYNPIGALPDAYRSLAPPQAIGVGIVFAVVAVVCLLFAGRGVVGLLMGGIGGVVGFKGFILALFTTLAGAAGIAAGSLLARMVFRGEGNLAFDVFLGGAALLPIGLGVLLSYLLAVIGISGPVGQLPALVGLSLTILVIFTGLGRVAGIKEGVASYLVAVVLAIGMLAAWLVGRLVGGVLY